MALFACSSYEFARHFVRFSNPSKLVMNLAGEFIDSVRKGNYARFGGRRRALSHPGGPVPDLNVCRISPH